MESKYIKYIISLIIIIAIGGGLYLYQKKKQGEELLAHNILQLEGITKIAKKSAPAGLQNMAFAIARFHKAKGHYPKKLIELYPEFIPYKPFITNVKWEYYPEKKTFLIKKNLGAGQIIASMGPNFIQRSEGGLSITSKPTIASVNKQKTGERLEKKAYINKLPTTKPATKKNIKKILLLKLKPPDLIKISGNMDSLKERQLPQSILASNIVKKNLNRNEKFLHSFDGDDFYIWKSEDGTLGFSNMQYPNEKNLAIYKDQSWIEYTKKPNIK